MPGHDQVRIARQVERSAVAVCVELGDEHFRIDDAAGAQDRGLARQDSRRDLADLVRLAARDDRVTGVRAALIAAHDVRLLGEQVDDLALPFVAPLRTDDYGRGHGWEVCLTLRLPGHAERTT